MNQKESILTHNQTITKLDTLPVTNFSIKLTSILVSQQTTRQTSRT